VKRPWAGIEWKVEVTFVPLESGQDEAYRNWVKAFVEGKRK
jgi:hypothetical protein